MTAYDWIMSFAAIAILGFAVRAFWRADKIESIDQPDNWTNIGGPDGGH